MKTVRELMQEIESLKGETVRVFGQPYTIPSESDMTLVDVVDVMSAWDGYEADLTISRLDYELIEKLENQIEELEAEIEEVGDDDFKRDVLEIALEEAKYELEEAYDNYIEEEAESIEEFLEHLEMCYGLEEKHSGNTYNQGGNITHNYYEHHYECGDGYHYVTLAIHRYGDVRCNYTDEVLLRFDSEWEAYEVISENDRYYHTVEINGEEYEACVCARYEDIEVWKTDGSYACTVYGYMSLEEMKEAIAEKLGIELVA